MAWGTNNNQQSTNDTHVVIDGRTGRIIDTDRDDDHRNNSQGNQQDRGTAQWTYDEYGRPTPYVPNSEF